MKHYYFMVAICFSLSIYSSESKTTSYYALLDKVAQLEFQQAVERFEKQRKEAEKQRRLDEEMQKSNEFDDEYERPARLPHRKGSAYSVRKTW